MDAANTNAMVKYVKTDDILGDMQSIINASQNAAYQAVNLALIRRNWLLGYRIAEEELKGEAEKNITYRYMLEEIANGEKIDATDEEVDAEAERLSQMYQMTKEELVNAFGGKDMIKYDLKMRRTIEFLKENN